MHTLSDLVYATTEPDCREFIVYTRANQRENVLNVSERIPESNKMSRGCWSSKREMMDS